MKCDCCGKEFAHQWVKAKYTLPGYLAEYYYCSEKCKQDHRLQLIRSSGL
jgi:YHS domain-containing protein